jgi:glc operon protein GlcG
MDSPFRASLFYVHAPLQEVFTMSISKIFVTLLLGAGLQHGVVQAQQVSPRDVVPDALPANIPYGMPISLERADMAIAAAVAEAKVRGWPLNVAVVDAGGHLLSFKRMDGAQLASIAIAQHKARVAATFRRDTKTLESALQDNNMQYLLTIDDVIASRGGLPIIEGGKLIGAIGCSGGAGSQDEWVCKAGLAALK